MQEPKPSPVIRDADVNVTRGDYFCVVVRIEGRPEISLQKISSKTVSVPPGTYRVSLQIDCGEHWVNAGKMTVKSGKKYIFKPKRPPRIDIDEI
ncbi:hypothetical protein ENSA7_81500 [Enhygromyxa salina]|uniref:Uncharacterized protein n=1 Tax=Enhygromyxa salina TaxID=215803 RepID=A0A2S9XLJ6_9BACT|nr:hypothetical protein ENSA7_81500 [Enhygromyxa salina]